MAQKSPRKAHGRPAEHRLHYSDGCRLTCEEDLGGGAPQLENLEGLKASSPTGSEQVWNGEPLPQGIIKHIKLIWSSKVCLEDRFGDVCSEW